jgi:hypothetical protein
VTERFNFYDLYGYLIPGLTLLALLWAPFGLTERRWPDLELSSAFVFLAAAYVLGLLLNRITTRFMTLKLLDRKSHKSRYPSEVLLDSDPEVRGLLPVTLDDHAYSQVLQAIQTTFPNITPCDPSVYHLCRIIVQSKGASYSEQFQGLYTLCQMLASALFLGGCYYLGWAWSHHIPLNVSISVLGLSILCFWLFHLSKGTATYVYLCLSVLLFGSGLVLGERAESSSLQLFALLGVGSAALSLPLLAAYKHFAALHALAVYQGFYIVTRMQALESSQNEGHSGTQCWRSDVY